MRVLLAGGGSGGSSAPVLAVAQELRRRGPWEMLYAGTTTGPERRLVEEMGIPYLAVATGKLRRYWDVQNFVDVFRVPLGMVQAVGIVSAFRPDVAFAAGGFAAVPPLVAAWLMRVPVVIHQQDVEPGLANRILAPFAAAVTVTFPSSLDHFPRKKSRLTGNPVRGEILAGSREKALRLFGFRGDLPVVLVTGGGTGAMGLNRIVAAAAPRLGGRCQVLHITGKGKGVAVEGEISGYRQVEFLTGEMAHALAAADLVVSRAGLSSLTELAALSKPSILVPMPDSHQKANAEAFGTAGAAVVVEERVTDAAGLAGVILELLGDEERLETLGKQARALMAPGAEARIADVIEGVAKRKREE